MIFEVIVYIDDFVFIGVEVCVGYGVFVFSIEDG